MAAIDNYVSEITDPALRQKITAALDALKKNKRFGLVFEEHLPETTALPGLLPAPGDVAALRTDPTVQTPLRILDITPAAGETAAAFAIVAPVRDADDPAAQTQTVPLADLMAVKRFGEPIFPGLSSVGSVRRGPTEKPSHAVINAENFHAVQLLLHLYEGQVDCLYLDPPYNTGAKDWTYNNAYVDSNDAWRHSKWLSFMEKRLVLARRLLKSDGVLIVTIDEHEVHHLGMLLERLFPDAYRQMVTMVINPKGVTQDRFSRVDEYAFFVFMSGSVVVGQGDDMLTPGLESAAEEEVDDEQIVRPRWKGLLRSGADSRRQDVKTMFFPVLIDEARGAIVGAGDWLPFDKEPNFQEKIDGYTAVWPVRTDGTLGRWSIGYVTMRRLIEKGYISLGGYDARRNTWAISYLSEQPQQQIEAGVLSVLSFDKAKNVVDVAYTQSKERRLKTVWHRTRHDAGVWGSDILTSLLGQDRLFAFPKSLY